MKNIYTLIIILISSGLCFAQDEEDVRIFYTEPVPVSDVINSEAEEVMPVYQNNRMYFVRAFHQKNTGGKSTGHDIWVAYQDDQGEWRRSNNYFLRLNNKGSNAVVGVSEGGNQVYLLNQYVEDDGKVSVPGISVSERRLTEWSEPTPLGIPGLQPNYRIYGLYMAPEEDALFISMQTEKTLGKEDLFISLKNNGQWTEPKHLESLSSEESDFAPFLAHDGSTLYFSSNRSGGMGGSDIYRTRKINESWTSWEEPENLGETINSDAFDAYFSMTKDSLAYFASNRDGGLSDIYASELISSETLTDEMITIETTYDLQYDWNRPNYVYFGFDKYRLRPSMKSFLQNVIDTLSQNEILRIRLEGHADAIGSTKYNKSLGKKRARAVQRFLVNNGIDKKKITTYSFGETMPVMPNSIAEEDFPVGRQMNRRVRIEIVDEETYESDKKGVKGYVN